MSPCVVDESGAKLYLCYASLTFENTVIIANLLLCFLNSDVLIREGLPYETSSMEEHIECTH